VSYKLGGGVLANTDPLERKVFRCCVEGGHRQGRRQGWEQGGGDSGGFTFTVLGQMGGRTHRRDR